MRIGYSFWGFLGAGITDTPDGGRSHRRVLVDGLTASGYEVVFLQVNRDLIEAGTDLRDRYRWEAGLPEVDAVFLEWRWPIAGRNTSICGTPGHTCDLHRQQEILDHYGHRGIPTVVWDKDRRLPADHPLRGYDNVVVCEPALHPTVGARRLLFPVADDVLDSADPAALARRERPWALAYAGNQYERDEAFTRFFAPAARTVPHRVAGKWPQATGWPWVNFTGRCPFPEVSDLYRSALATVLLLPDRYSRVGHMTQRIFEAVLAGCLPITPMTLVDADRFTPPELHVSTGAQVADLIADLCAIEGSADHVALITACLERLDIFRLSSQLAVVDDVLGSLARTTSWHSRSLKEATQ